MLCGIRKKPHGSPAYLHELHGIKRTAVRNEQGEVCQADSFREEPLEPEKKIAPDDRLDAVFVDHRVLHADVFPVFCILVRQDDRVLVGKGDPVIRHEGRRQECMRLTAFGAPDTADPEGMFALREKDSPPVVGVNGKAGRMPAGACQPVELEAVNDRIIIIL